MWCSGPSAPAPEEKRAPAASELSEIRPWLSPTGSPMSRPVHAPGAPFPISAGLTPREQGPLRAFPDALRSDSSFPSGSRGPCAAPTAHGVHQLPSPNWDMGLPASQSPTKAGMECRKNNLTLNSLFSPGTPSTTPILGPSNNHPPCPQERGRRGREVQTPLSDPWFLPEATCVPCEGMRVLPSLSFWHFLSSLLSCHCHAEAPGPAGSSAVVLDTPSLQAQVTLVPPVLWMQPQTHSCPLPPGTVTGLPDTMWPCPSSLPLSPQEWVLGARGGGAGCLPEDRNGEANSMPELLHFPALHMCSAQLRSLPT